jgi:hypothetical protein
MEYWNSGITEYWNVGTLEPGRLEDWVLNASFHYSIIPVLTLSMN